MRVIDHHHIVASRNKRNRRRRVGRLVFTIIIIFSLLGINYLRPIPLLKPTQTKDITFLSTPVNFSWPKQGQSAIGAVGFTPLSESPNQKPAPIASVAKVFTAAMVLKKYPLDKGQQGPVLTVGQADIDIYNWYVEQGGSVLPVNFGEQLTQYQALQAMLLPSANNISDMLAVWAYGSMENYLIEANKYVKSLGLHNTQLADASGFSAETTSTAHDVVMMGASIMKNDVFAEIVNTGSAEIPVAGLVTNSNKLLANPQIIGIKTGHTDQAGGCYLFAARHQLSNNESVVIVGSVMNAPDIDTAIGGAVPLLNQAVVGFRNVKLITAGQNIAEYSLPWGGTVTVQAERDVNKVIWNEKIPEVTTNLKPLKYTKKAGDVIGNITIKSDYYNENVDIKLKDNIAQPSVFWRLFRIK